MVQDQELKIVPVIRQKLLLQVHHHLKQVEVLARVVVVHRGGQTAAIVIERIRDMGDLPGAMNRDGGEFGIFIPELFFRKPDVLDQAAPEELVVGKTGRRHGPFFTEDVLSCRAAVRKVRQDLTEGQIGIFPLGRGNQAFVHLRGDPVVAVHIADPIAGGKVKADISRSPLPAVFHCPEPEAGRICITVFLQDLLRSVCRAVVDDDQLVNVSCLGEDRIQALPDGLLGIVCRNDHTKLHSSAPPWHNRSGPAPETSRRTHSADAGLRRKNAPGR